MFISFDFYIFPLSIPTHTLECICKYIYSKDKWTWAFICKISTVKGNMRYEHAHHLLSNLLCYGFLFRKTMEMFIAKIYSWLRPPTLVMSTTGPHVWIWKFQNIWLKVVNYTNLFHNIKHRHKAGIKKFALTARAVQPQRNSSHNMSKCEKHKKQKKRKPH